MNRLKPKHAKIQYFKRNKMETIRNQFSPSNPLCQKKLGPKRQLGLDDEVLLVLMCISISAGYMSKIFTTITFFLVRELKPLIYWLTPAQTLSYKHPHFSGDFNKVEGIGTLLSDGCKNHQTLKLSIKLIALIQVITLSRSLLFVPKVVRLVTYRMHMQV